MRGSQDESIGSGTFGLDGCRSELLRLLADEDLTSFGGRREHHRTGVHIPREPKRTRPSHQRLAGREAEAAGQARTMTAQQNARFGVERVSRLQARPHRPKSIVLVQAGYAEYAHQAFTGADRQLSAVPLENCCQTRF